MFSLGELLVRGIKMTNSELLQYCMAKTGAEQSVHSDWKATQIKVEDVLFAMVKEVEERPAVSLKTSPELAELLRQQHSDVRQAGILIRRTGARCTWMVRCQIHKFTIWWTPHINRLSRRCQKINAGCWRSSEPFAGCGVSALSGLQPNTSIL